MSGFESVVCQLARGRFGRWLLLVPLVVVAPRARAAEPVAAVLESAAKSFLGDARSVGLSLGVIQRGEVFTCNLGSTIRGQATPPTEHTVYPIASLTKTFAGTLLALAATEGKLKLDDDVRRFLKGGFPNLEFDGHPVRLRDLLNHRSGLPFMLPDRPELRPGYQNEPVGKHLERLAAILDRYTRADFLADLRQVRLNSIPGREFQYSNAAAQLAGYILEDIYGMSFGELVAAKISRPRGLADTVFKLEPAQLARLAQGHDGECAPLPPPRDEWQAAGALKSTVSDLLKYLRWHLDETNPSIRLSHTPTFTDKNYSTGLNWQMLAANGRRLIWQEGNVPGYTSYLIFEPELDLGLVLLTNESDRTSSPRLTAIANRILEALDSRAVLLP